MKKPAAALLAMCLMTASGCAGSVELAKSTFTFELGRDVYANPSLYLKDTSGVNLDKVEIETTTPGVAMTKNRFVTQNQEFLAVGEYDFVLTYRNKEYPFVIKIKDTQAPAVTVVSDTIEVSLNQEIDWSQVFSAHDLSGVYFEALFDASGQAGEHSVDVRIYDRFGNSVTKTVTVVVNG